MLFGWDDYGVVVFTPVTQESIGTSRRYRSALREQQAAETRRRILIAAGDLFTEFGYARTTLAKIGVAAGVSTETVQAHGPKAALMIAALEYASFGVEGDQNVMDLDYGKGLLAIDELDAALDYVIRAQTEVHARSAPLHRALRGAAANDPELHSYYVELLAGVARQTRRIMEVFRDRGWLRDDVAFDELVQWTMLIFSIDGYEQMVLREGWSTDAYQRYVREADDMLLRRR